jgi:serine/threonine protein kinase
MQLAPHSEWQVLGGGNYTGGRATQRNLARLRPPPGVYSAALRSGPTEVSRLAVKVQSEPLDKLEIAQWVVELHSALLYSNLRKVTGLWGVTIYKHTLTKARFELAMDVVALLTVSDESEGKLALAQLLVQLVVLRRMGICHRDCKPDNLVLTGRAESATVVIDPCCRMLLPLNARLYGFIDFGVALDFNLPDMSYHPNNQKIHKERYDFKTHLAEYGGMEPFWISVIMLVASLQHVCKSFAKKSMFEDILLGAQYCETLIRGKPKALSGLPSELRKTLDKTTTRDQRVAALISRLHLPAPKHGTEVDMVISARDAQQMPLDINAEMKIGHRVVCDAQRKCV